MCNLKIITLSEQFQAPDFQGNITSTIRIRVSLVTVSAFTKSYSVYWRHICTKYLSPGN